MIGTSADWFLWIVTRSLSLYSNRSPSSCPFAAASALPIASSALTRPRDVEAPIAPPRAPRPVPGPPTGLAEPGRDGGGAPATTTVSDTAPSARVALIVFVPADTVTLVKTFF